MPKVFVSHSSQDRDFVLTCLLPTLREAGWTPWYSDEQITAADQWKRTILTGLTDCPWFLVALSPPAVNSEWVSAELDWAMEHRRGRIIPVRYQDCSPDQLHLNLRNLQHIPLPSDTRANRDRLIDQLQRLEQAPSFPLGQPSFPQPNVSNSSMKPAKILFLASGPSDQARLALGREWREIDERLQLAPKRDCLHLESVMEVRPKDLLRSLLRHSPRAVHFCGHGNSVGELIFVDESGKGKPVSPDAIKSLLQALKENIRVVVLNACFSKIQAEACREVIDCTIGMDGQIGDSAAITFSAAFYEASAYGKSVEKAFEVAKVALRLEGIPSNQVPVLLCRDGVNPDNVYMVD